MSAEVSRFSPGAEQQTVVVGAWQDPADILKRRQRRTEAAIKGGTTDAHYKIKRGDLVFTYNQKQRVRGPATGKKLVTAFASFNNYGDKGQTKKQIIESVRMLGIAAEATNPDSANGSPNMDFNAQIGGTITRPNDGPDTVYPGDPLYWDAPENTKEAMEKQSHIDGPEDRYTGYQRRYDPSKQKVHVDLIRSVVTKEGNGQMNVALDTVVVDGAKRAYRSVAEIAMIAVLMERAGVFGSRSGSMAGLQGNITEADIVNRISVLLQANTADADGVERLCEALGLIRISAVSKQQNWDPIANGNVDLPDLITRMFMPKKTLEHIAKPQDGRAPGGLAGRVYSAQTGALQGLLAAVMTTNFHTTQRIFAECLTKAGPGGDCHIKISTYSM